ncbi:MAG: mannose-6-phosphate isomerase, class I, partial [Candidatus Sumerlaeota bacterium]|nr:mannose-6-phosphate isomerase, class I [Candidatus Sumerlaeota bacterium]
MLSQIHLLKPTIQTYAWGSKTAIPELIGQPNPGDEPQAELWMGAHPKAPSRLVCGDQRIPLNEAIAAYPREILGPAVAEAFANQLPFLFKVLAAEEPLSIQAHPNLEQAREGFARENAAGIPLDAPARNYRDDNHKPELLCALTEFFALVGFRRPETIPPLFERLGASALRDCLAPLRQSPSRDGLRAFFEALMALPVAVRRRALEQAAAGAA